MPEMKRGPGRPKKEPIPKAARERMYWKISRKDKPDDFIIVESCCAQTAIDYGVGYFGSWYRPYDCTSKITTADWRRYEEIRSKARQDKSARWNSLLRISGGPGSTP